MGLFRGRDLSGCPRLHRLRGWISARPHRCSCSALAPPLHGSSRLVHPISPHVAPLPLQICSPPVRPPRWCTGNAPLLPFIPWVGVRGHAPQASSISFCRPRHSIPLRLRCRTPPSLSQRPHLPVPFDRILPRHRGPGNRRSGRHGTRDKPFRSLQNLLRPHAYRHVYSFGRAHPQLVSLVWASRKSRAAIHRRGSRSRHLSVCGVGYRRLSLLVETKGTTYTWFAAIPGILGNLFADTQSERDPIRRDHLPPGGGPHQPHALPSIRPVHHARSSLKDRRCIVPRATVPDLSPQIRLVLRLHHTHIARQRQLGRVVLIHRPHHLALRSGQPRLRLHHWQIVAHPR